MERQPELFQYRLIIILLGLFLASCNYGYFINNPANDTSNLPITNSDDLSAAIAPYLDEGSGLIDVDTLTSALEADGFTQDEIRNNLDAIIQASESADDGSVSCVQFLDLMSKLRSSQDDLSSGKIIKDTNSGLIEKSLCGDIASSSNYDPDTELVSDYLICPTIPNATPLIPPGPYDEEIGDCALRRKSAEIEAWLYELEQIAASCQANGETNWATALAARDHLNAEIDELEMDEVVETETIENVFGQAVGLTEREPTICPSYSIPGGVITIDPDNTPGTTHHYTNWLKRIGEDVEKYCTMTNELIEPLWQACDEINFYQDCQEPDHEQYHAIIELRMNIAQNNYDSTALFYINSLQNDGWGDFRSSFNVGSIDCPLDPFAPNTKFTFSMNTFCRKGPSTKYGKVATFLELEKVQIEGRNQSDPRWWWVLVPGSSEHCWVSDSTGSAEGPLDEVEPIPAPPLVIDEGVNDQGVCSKDLGQSDCDAAGGDWVDGGAVGASYCDCK